MNKTSLNRNQIKYIAIIAMIIDHIGMFLLSPGISEKPAATVAIYAALRTIGRLTGPIMLFFLSEGFVHTSSRKKYAIRLLVFGLISQIPYALSHYNSLKAIDFNVIITLFLTFLMLLSYEKIRNRFINFIVCLLLLILSSVCDWGIIGPFMAWLFYRFRSDRKTQIKAYAILCAVQLTASVVFLATNGHHWYGELWQAGMFLVIPFLLAYNGKAGKRSAFNKWAFYLIYPLHFLIFWAIRYL